MSSCTSKTYKICPIVNTKSYIVLPIDLDYPERLQLMSHDINEIWHLKADIVSPQQKAASNFITPIQTGYPMQMQLQSHITKRLL